MESKDRDYRAAAGTRDGLLADLRDKNAALSAKEGQLDGKREYLQNKSPAYADRRTQYRSKLAAATTRALDEAKSQWSTAKQATTAVKMSLATK